MIGTDLYWLARLKLVNQIIVANIPLSAPAPDDDGPIQMSSSWRLNQRFYKRLPVQFENRTSLSKQKSIRFRVFNHVTTSQAVSWNLNQRFFKQEQVRFKDLWRVRTFTIGGIRFNALRRLSVRDWQLQGLSPGNISTGLVHPIDYSTPNLQLKSYKGLGTPVVNPIDYDNYPGYGQIVIPGIAWRLGIDPSGRVQCQCAIAFRNLNKVSNKQNTSWNLIHRSNYTRVSLFNVYVPVKNSTIIEWNVGMWVKSHIRQTAQNRIDFAY